MTISEHKGQNPNGEGVSLFREKAQRLIDEDVGVLEDAAMARIREDAKLRAR
jgi:hypothetical protein